MIPSCRHLCLMLMNDVYTCFSVHGMVGLIMCRCVCVDTAHSAVGYDVVYISYEWHIRSIV